MKIFRKSMQQSIVEEPTLTSWYDGTKDLEDILFYTAHFLEETKRKANKILVRSSIDALMQKVDIIFETSRLQNLVDGWIQSSKYALSEPCCPINEMKIAFKNSFQDTKRHITRIYFLLNELKDGDFDQRFLWRLQAEGLIDMEEYEVYSSQKKDFGKYWTLTVQEKEDILTMMRERAIEDFGPRPMPFLQRLKCLSCIAKPRRRVSESIPEDTTVTFVVNKRAKSSAGVGMKGGKNDSKPETKRRNFRNSLSAFCRSVSAFFTA